ncbi:fibronectin type III domain-containing protein, partial [Flavobacterium subsaxonicum]
MKKITLMFFMFFISLCSYAQLAEEGFEGTWTTQTGTGLGGPAGWALANIGTGSQVWWIQGDGSTQQPAFEGTHSAFLEKENVATNTFSEDWLITKSFPLPVNPQLHFYSKLFFNADQSTQFKIYIAPATNAQTNTTGYGTPVIEWTELQLNPTQLAWTEKTVDIPTTIAAGTEVYLAFVMKGDNAERWAIDNVSVTAKCLDPTLPTATSPGLTTANLNWGNPSGATQWEIEIVGPNLSPTGTGDIYDGPLPYVAGGPLSEYVLLPDTTYTYYVRARCSDGGKSAWIGPVTFSTVALGEGCGAPIVVPSALPYTTTDNTSNYGDTVDGSPGATGCGTTGGYLNGNDVFYAYTPTTSGVISIDVTNNGTWTGVFVYNSCANVGVSCVGGASSSAATALSIPQLSVTAGTTYYIVISTNATPQTTPYTLTIQQVNCPKPEGGATVATATSAQLNWTNPGNATSFQVVVQTPGAGVPSGAGTTTTSNVNYPVTATTAGVAFTEATSYEYYVRADCGDGTFSAWAGPFSFMTTQVPGTLNYTQDFEGVHGFSLSNGTATNKWAVGTATANGGTHSLYISNNNGVANAYNTSASSVVHAFRDLAIPAGADQVNLSFDWKNVGENGFDYIRVWMVPATYLPAVGTQITAATDRVQIGGNLVGSSAWTTVNTILTTTPYIGTTRRLIFEWRNDGSVGTQPPAAIDNVNLSVITCSQPGNLAVTATDTQATYTWTGPSSGTATYQYYLATGSTPPTAGTPATGTTTATTYVQTPLEPSTTYYFWVKSDCGTEDGVSFWTGPVSFTTPQVPVVLPYVQDFESENSGFALNNGTQTNKWFVGTATSNSPTHSLYISNDNGVSNAYNTTATSTVQAYRDIMIPAGAGDINISFDWKNAGENSFDFIRVWMVPVDFTPVAGTQITAGTGRVQLGGNLNSNSNWTTLNFIQNVSAYANVARRLVFEWRNDGSVGTQPPAAIDNLNISVITCPQPTNLSADTTTTTATLNWNEVGTATEWVVYVQPAGTAAPVQGAPGGVTVTEHPVTIENLEPSANLQYYVQAVCSDDDSSLFSGPFLFEMDPLCPEPTDLMATCLSANSAAYSWEAGGGETSWEYVVLPATAPEPTTGTVVTTPSAVSDNLTVATQYTLYVRAVCATIEGYSPWAEYNFATPSVGPGDAQPFCAGDSGVAVPNSTGVTGYGSIGCLGSTPNPVWYYLTIDQPGNLVFLLSQVNNNGVGIDVDFAAFGPFTSETDACSQIELVPGANPLIVACSYSAAAIENFTISNAQAGQVYALLITNFNGSAGQITLTQTNATAPGAGTTSCNVTVDLGTDQILCATDEADVTATIGNPTDASGFTYTWFVDGVEIENPDVVATSDASETIHVTQLGTHVYSVIVTNPDAVPSDDPITDQISVSLSPVFVAPTPAPITVCTAGTTAAIDLSAINFLEGLDPDDYEVVGVYNSTANANTGTNPINVNVPFNATSQTLYVVIADSNVLSCTQIVPLVITVSAAPTATIAYAGPYCSTGANGTATITGATGGTFTYVATTAGDVLVLDPATGAITMAGSDAGTYTVTYTVAATTTCPEFVTTTTVVINEAPTAQIGYGNGTFCSNVGTIEANAIVGTLGGTYTITGGLTIDPATGDITVDGTTTPGTYTVTYTIAATGPCAAFTTTFDITIVTQPVAAISYAGTPYCSGTGTATVTQTGSIGGVYTSTDGLVIDATTGEIDLAASTAGTYTVTYTVAAAGGCPEFAVTTSVTINQAPDATIEYTSVSFCSNAGVVTPGIIGTGGGTFSATGITIDPVTGAIDTATATEGTYTVTYTIAASGPCAEFVTTTEITITAQPVATITYGTAPFCTDAGTATVTQTGATGGVYTAAAGLIIDPATGEINLAASTADTYEVTYTVAAAGGCDAVVATANVVITALPKADFSYAFTTICTNAANVAATLTTGGTAGTYTVDVPGLTIDPVTGTITPATSLEGTYVVTNTVAASGGCAQVTATFTVNIIPAPIPTFTYASVAYCQDETTNPSPILTDAAGTFSASPAGLSINATTGVIDLAASTPGTYTVSNTVAGTTDCPSVTATTTITITALPVVTVIHECINNEYTLSVSFENDLVNNPDTVSYSWNSGSVELGTDETLVIRDGGTYSVTVTPLS